ncbi:flagellar biosynthesis anti-sigma factor FlgM [Sphingomonas sp. ID0503]|uniref:flagellar biosynthesis anti-sigma factor FlgM n=1 Tax=Sphingomonas sp. ID0503 TaxID=3399691 RepID=UPI003AFA1EA8
MVDPIASRLVKIADKRTEVARVETAVVKTPAATSVTKTADMVVSGASETAKSLASAPPVDSERVARIKRAIQDGKFPMVPSTIADRLIAFEQGWRLDDAA